MVEVKFYDNIADELLKFAVIISKTDNKWVFCKHKERETYEVPGGHREPGESIFETAKRELQEETGAIDFKIEPLFRFGAACFQRIIIKIRHMFAEFSEQSGLKMLDLSRSIHCSRIH